MKKLVHALVLTGLVGLPTFAMAEETPAAEESPHSLSANVSLTSNYIFRGISQTGGDPAIQGGFDYGHSSGFYLGTWASNVGWIEDFQGYDSGNVEIDLYGGFRGSVGDTDFTYDVGAIQYWYPGDKPSGVTSADTTEIYGAAGWKWFTAKYSYYVSNEVFGFGNADGSYYLGLAGSLPIQESGFTVGATWGTFKFKNNGNQDYDDWSISGTYDMGKLSKVADGVTVGLKYTDTNADRAYWTDANGQDLSKGTATFWVSKAF
jgi:uncharacterized protein (TIGR02001 family)